MRGCWITDLPGSYGSIQHANIWSNVVRNGLTRLYIDARQIKASDVDFIHSKGVEVGIFGNSNWVASAAGLADLLDATLTTIGATAKQCAVMVDIEQHDPDYVLNWLTAWRKKRATRMSAWTVEPHQAGWFTPALVNAIVKDPNLTVVAQAYLGNMYPCAHDAVRADLETKLPADRCSVFYDAKDGAPGYMDGYLFTMERLPL